MKPLPLPLRVAAGVAVTAAEQARKLPEHLVGLPITVASQALQLSMRVQQGITELAIRGDQALAGLRESPAQAEWATFDEDEVDHDPGGERGARSGGRGSVVDTPVGGATPTGGTSEGDDERRSGASGPADGGSPRRRTSRSAQRDTRAGRATAADQAGPRSSGDAPATGAPRALPEYPDLSLAQLRGHLRSLSAADLSALLEYEQGQSARPEYVRMLANRLRTVTDA
ncbi:lipid droplet-associated protein [Actinoalloteichus spitiensis]|uniref:lipid droplet-associated protein n=1 Tax=Actinoalloteichus spitiensis TaxID=252394 RepID=UPI00037F48D6|nr:lipid droplet-associated protein [Actinoalloteichus spitiensis]